MTNAADIGRMVAHGPQRPLTEEETMTLLRLCYMSEETVDDQILFYNDMMAKSPALQIITSRFSAVFGDEMKFSPTLMVWLSTLADRPGHAVLMVAVLAYAISEGCDLTISSIITHYFTHGIPTDENYRLAWDAQKTNETTPKFTELVGFGHDNVLDYKEAWK